MKILIIYDSVYGNTEKIAQAIAASLAVRGEVRTLRVGDAKPDALANVDMLVAGAPTHGSMPSPGTKAWLKTLPVNSLRGVPVAAFDTRVAASETGSRIASVFIKLFGYAGEKIAGELKKRGGTLAAPAEGFFVKDTEGPLKEGELERAAAWAQTLPATL